MPLMSTLTWNVCRQRDERQRPVRPRRIAAALERWQPTVCCLQEVAPELLQALPRLLPGYRLLIGEVRHLRWHEAAVVLARSDRCEVVEHHSYWLGERPERPVRDRDAAFPRMVTRSRLDWRPVPGHGPVRVEFFSCHLDHRGRQARDQGASQLQASVEGRSHVIVAGDLNSPPGGAAYRRLVGPPPRLQDAWVAAERRRGPGATWRDPFGVIRRRIDYVLTSHDIQVRRCRVEPLPAGSKPISDHLPVCAELELRS